MSSYLHKLSRTKHRLFRAAKRDQQHSSWERYIEARNKCNKEFSKAEKKYFSAQQALLSDLSPSSHQYGGLKQSRTHASLDLSLGCQTWNTMVFRPQQKTRKPTFWHCSLLNQNSALRQPTLSRMDLSAHHSHFIRNTPSFSFPKIHEKDVHRILKKLSPHKVTGGDNMSCRLLQEGASLLSESLTYIFNLSIFTCRFPR